MPPLNWETERLVLKPATSADAQEAWESYTADPEVSRFMTWRPHASIDETEDFFRRCEDVWKQGAAWPWALRLKSPDQAGTCFTNLVMPSPENIFEHTHIKMFGRKHHDIQSSKWFTAHGIDIGYLIVPTLWRRGLMGEAVTGLLSWAFDMSDICRVWAVCDVDNVASARLLESVGMELEGTLRCWLIHPNISQAPRDCLCFLRDSPPWPPPSSPVTAAETRSGAVDGMPDTEIYVSCPRIRQDEAGCWTTRR